MRRRAIAAALLVVSLLASAANAASTNTITFNSLSSGPYATYTEAAVTFLASVPAGTFSALSSPNGTVALIGEGSPRTPIRANISGGTDFVSVDMGDFNADADLMYLRAFNAANVMIAQTQLAITAADTTMHTMVVNVPGIDHVEWGSLPPSENGSSVFGDNFTYAIPEPAAASLLMMAAIAPALRRRRA